MNKNRLNLIMLYLVVSLIFVIPLNISFVSATNNVQTTSQFDRDRAVSDPSGSVGRGKVASTCGGTGLDFDSSIILSMVSLCLPGVIKKAMEYKKIGCEKVKCKYDTILMGKTDFSKCNTEYSYKTCTYIVGEIFAMPPMFLLEYLRNIIKNILANPIGMAYSAGIIVARFKLNKCPVDNTCSTIPMRGIAILLTINDILSVVQTLKDMAENGIGLESSDNACDDMADIKTEMEEIVAAMN